MPGLLSKACFKQFAIVDVLRKDNFGWYIAAEIILRDKFAEHSFVVRAVADARKIIAAADHFSASYEDDRDTVCAR